MNEMDENGNSSRSIPVGDPSDWRLVMVISRHGMEAYLRNVENPMSEVETLFRLSWEGDDDNLLSRIENAVYDHPQLLDDFAADIAIETNRVLWAPEAVVDGDDDPGEMIFKEVFAADDDDIMRDYADGCVCLYTLAPGLQSFLQRTFPGARIRCHQSVLVRRLGERTADMPRVYIDVRRNEADYIVMDGRRLLLAVTHDWHDKEDIRYHLFNILEAYGLDPKAVHVSLSGEREIRNELVQGLRREVAYVMMTLVPGIAVKAGMSLTAAMLMRT